MRGKTRSAHCWRVLLVLGLMMTAPLLQAADRLVVYTVNYPLQYFAQRIAGEHADVVFPAPADVDPAFWQPDATTITAYQQADLILLNGAGYAKWLDRVSLPRRRLVTTAAGFAADYIETAGTVTHSHGREGSHSHAGTAFTTWLDFGQAVMQANAVRDALSRLRPLHAEVFAANARALETDLLGLDARMQAIVYAAPGTPLVASHPVYQYMARRYGINLEAVMWEPDTLPGAAQWLAFERLLKDHPAGWMLWEGDPIQESIERLQQHGVQSIVFDPCGNAPGEGDFLDVMSSNLRRLDRVFRSDDPGGVLQQGIE
jgi:zinc transport system substrate-binding protein